MIATARQSTLEEKKRELENVIKEYLILQGICRSKHAKNYAKILTFLIFSSKYLSKKQIAKKLNMHESNLSRYLETLLEYKLIIEVELKGEKSKYYRAKPPNVIRKMATKVFREIIDTLEKHLYSLEEVHEFPRFGGKIEKDEAIKLLIQEIESINGSIKISVGDLNEIKDLVHSLIAAVKEHKNTVLIVFEKYNNSSSEINAFLKEIEGIPHCQVKNKHTKYSFIILGDGKNNFVVSILNNVEYQIIDNLPSVEFYIKYFNSLWSGDENEQN